ncbi:SPFH domain-containing protein [Marinoscillum furvescens]|uniref:SPFH domain/Band 7 family protein n=1 Tax=Marinoscillum furvescens DSM 4134 TaxID=1122208 RepID=A0A3D9L709_MARFU|nr:SPFH domain-containing protein [Marinoscillum furvescens]REE02141.1 SPFH domain/Band 7 family protein [Marinoscillum furvescens DSM 4134]
MIFIGILALLFGLFMFFLRPNLAETDEFEGELRVRKKAPPFLLMFSKRISLAISTLGLIFILLPYMFFWAEPGYQYFLVYPTGNTDVVMNQGIKFRGFAKVISWQKYIDVKVVDSGESSKEIEGAMKPIPIRFIDQVTAEVRLSGRFQLPTVPEDFIALAIKYRSMENLVQNTLIPTVREQAINTGYMYAAQDYISGEAQSFRQTLDEQLKDGAYAVIKIENRDTVYNDAIQEVDARTIKEIRTRYTVEKVIENGFPKRIPHELTENNIIVSQVIVDDVVLEPTFKKRLEAQRDESAKRQIEQQKVETAKAAQTRIIAEGERDKAQERVTQEKEQVKQLIAIETKLKQERTNKELAAIALETERLKAQQRKVTADAKAYENAKLVSAGLTPQEKAEWEYKTSVGVATELAKLKFPQTMIIADDKKGGTPLESLIGAAMAKQLTQGQKK